MKHKLLTFALMGAFASTMLFSCKNAEEPIPSLGDNNSGEMVEYSISVNIPEEMRTRGTTDGIIGESGLYEFPIETVDNLWYCMYYDGAVKKSGEVSRTDENPFSISLRVDGNTDPSKVWFFFWAGNKVNNFAALDYEKRNVRIIPKKIFSQISHLDAFTGYFQFAPSDDTSIRTQTFTLKRPFAEIHILSDDFLPSSSDLYKNYTSGVSTVAGFGNEILTQSNYEKQMYYPTTWYFDDDPSGTHKKNDLVCESQHQAQGAKLTDTFFNPLDQTTVERVTFNNRIYDYISCFYMFAPLEEAPLNHNSTELNLLNFFITGGNPSNWASFYGGTPISVELPENGLKANNKYVIYNKSHQDGGSGFLDGFYDYEILVNHDGTWESPNHENEVDKL